MYIGSNYSCFIYNVDVIVPAWNDSFHENETLIPKYNTSFNVPHDHDWKADTITEFFLGCFFLFLAVSVLVTIGLTIKHYYAKKAFTLTTMTRTQSA